MIGLGAITVPVRHGRVPDAGRRIRGTLRSVGNANEIGALNNRSRSRSRRIPGVWRALRLDEKNMSFFICDGTMLDAFGHYKYFSRAQRDGSVSQLNGDAAAQHKKKIVRVIMLVPDKFALHFDDHEVMAVELPHDAGSPIICKRGQLVGQVYGFHKIPTMNNLGNGNNT
jgi:hypothetical protein